MKIKYLGTETRRCGYFDDGREATMDYWGHDDLSKMRFEKDIPEKYRKARFELMRKGLLGDAFSAATTDCVGCNACVPLRINTFEFQTTTRQQGVLSRFKEDGGESIWMKPIGVPALYDLFKKYVSNRFPESPMLDYDRETLFAMLHSKSELLLLTNKSNKQQRRKIKSSRFHFNAFISILGQRAC